MSGETPLEDTEETAEVYQSGGVPTPARVELTFGAGTHPGKVRANNEDHFLVARLAK